MKSKLNDYSAFQNIFRDGALSIIIGSGLLNTLVPNAIEYLGQVKSLSSFDALNLFSVVYFVVPILIITTYWFLRGSRLFFMEKLNKEQSRRYNTYARLNAPLEAARWIITFAKIAPVVLFIRDETLFSDTRKLIVLGAGYITLCVGQLILSTLSHQSVFERPGIQSKAHRKLRLALRYQAFCIDSLIFFLDSIVGITLVVFSMPWIIYHQAFFPVCALLICAYALSNWCYSVNAFEDCRLRIEDFIVAVLICACSLSFPALNLHFYELASILVAVGFVAVTLWWFWRNRDLWPRLKRLQKSRWTPLNTLVPSVLIFIAVVTFSHFMVHKGIVKLNYAYMQNRVDASLHIHAHNNLPESSGMKLTLRQFYYPKYLALHDERLLKQHTSQNNFDTFYQSVYDHVSVARPKLDSAVRGVSQQERDHLQPFLHPLDFTANRLMQLRHDLTQMDTVLRLCDIIAALPADTLREAEKWDYISNRLEEAFKKVDPKISLDSLNKVKRRYKVAREITGLLHAEAYQDAQHIYRSYLTDTQRIGVWTFLVSVIILATAATINNQVLTRVTPSGNGNGSATPPVDTPKNALLIQCLAILILLIPLAKHIEPENIDPEKPYWMMSLQNWYAPTFFRSLTKPQPEKYKAPGATTVENKIDLNELKVALAEIARLREDHQRLMHRLDSTANELNRTLMKFDTYDENRPVRSKAKTSK